jgi:hypothetical protein
VLLAQGLRKPAATLASLLRRTISASLATVVAPAGPRVVEIVQRAYVVHHISEIMLSVWLCGEGAFGLAFSLLSVI